MHRPIVGISTYLLAVFNGFERKPEQTFFEVLQVLVFI
jgi:hypothetical protein